MEFNKEVLDILAGLPLSLSILLVLGGILFALYKIFATGSQSQTAALASMQVSIDSLQKQLDALQAQHQLLNVQLTNATEKAVKLEIELGHLKNELEDAISDKERMEGSMVKAEKEAQAAQEVAKEWQAQLDALSARFKGLQQRVKLLEGLLRENGIGIPEMEDEDA